MPLSTARAALSRINHLVDQLGDQGRRPARIELDLLREHVRRLYDAIDEVDVEQAPYSGNAQGSNTKVSLPSDPDARSAAPAPERPLDLGRARERFSGANNTTSGAPQQQPVILHIPDELEDDLRRIEAERAAEQVRAADAARQAAEHAERERIAAEAAERERRRADEQHQAQLLREQRDRDRLAAEAAERQRSAEEARERQQREQAERERLDRQQADRDHAEAARAQREANEREKVRLAQLEQDYLHRERLAREQAAEQQRQAAAITLVPVEVAEAARDESSAALPRALKELFTIERATDLSDRLANSPIADLSRAMALNDQLLVRNELFGGSQELMNSTLLRLNSLQTYEAAVDILAEPARQFDWAEEERRPTARTFVKLVRRRYA